MKIKSAIFVLLIAFFVHPLFAGVISDALAFENLLEENSPVSPKHKKTLEDLIAKLNLVKAVDLPKVSSGHEAEDVLNRLFKIKLLVRQTTENSSAEIIVLKRKALMGIRYIEDLIVEKNNEILKNRKKNKAAVLPLAGGKSFNQTSLENPLDLKSLQSGDVLLIRGNSIISATISRISEAPGAHSHIGLIYKDSKMGQVYFVESLASTGL